MDNRSLTSGRNNKRALVTKPPVGKTATKQFHRAISKVGLVGYKAYGTVCGRSMVAGQVGYGQNTIKVGNGQGPLGGIIIIESKHWTASLFEGAKGEASLVELGFT
jgi:hypothetical protein